MTGTPPAGAGPLSVSVPVAGCPAATAAGSMLTDRNVGACSKRCAVPGGCLLLEIGDQFHPSIGIDLAGDRYATASREVVGAQHVGHCEGVRQTRGGSDNGPFPEMNLEGEIHAEVARLEGHADQPGIFDARSRPRHCDRQARGAITLPEITAGGRKATGRGA